MGQGRDQAGNIWELDANNNPVRLLQKAPSAATEAIASNPIKQQGAVLDNQQTSAQTAATLAGIKAQREQIALERAKFEAAQREKGFTPDGNGGWVRDPKWQPPKPASGRPEITAPQFGDALAQFNAGSYLRNQQILLSQKFKNGPGGTTGLTGLLDYLPTQSNSDFNTTANRLRAWAKQGTGTTGGENNSVAEMKMNLGSYIPNSWEYDKTNESTLASIAGLADNAQQNAIQRLGGVPDASGNILPLNSPEAQAILNGQTAQKDKRNDPLSAAALVAGNGPQLGNGGGMLTGQGPDGPNMKPAEGAAYSTPNDMAMAKALQAAYNQGASVPELFAVGKQFGLVPDMQNAQQWQAAVDYRDGTGEYKGKKRGFANFNAPESGRRGMISQTFGDMASSPVGTAALAAANAGSFGLVDEAAALINPGDYENNRDYYNFAKNAAFDQNPGAALVGDIAGGVTGGAAIAGATDRLFNIGAKVLPKLQALRKANSLARATTDGAAYGGAFGAGEGNDNRLTGALTGTVAGGTGALLSAGALKALSRSVGGTRSAAKQYLADRGITLTPGQALGGPMRFLEERVGGRALSDAEGFNRAAFNEAVAPAGGTVNKIGPEGVDQALQVGRNAYHDALSPVSLNLHPDELQAINQGFANARKALGPNAADIRANMDYTLDSELGPILAKAQSGNPLNGDDVQTLLRVSGRNQQVYDKLATAGGADGIPKPLASPVAGAFGVANDAVRTSLGRQSPEALAKLQAADKVWRNVKTLQSAVNKARNGAQTESRGAFGINQLTDAAAESARKYGGSHGTTNQPFYDLTKNAGEVMPNYFPNSGTAVRTAVMNGLAGVTGLGAYKAQEEGWIDPKTALALAAVAGLYSTPGRKALTGVFGKTSKGRQSLERSLEGLIPALGRVGAASVPLTLPAYLQPVN